MVKDILGVTIYVDDFASAYDFYAHLLGLERSMEAGENACFFRLNGNEQAIYLEGGHAAREQTADSNALSFMMVVDYAPDAFDRLKEAGVRMVHDAPQDLGDGNYWFRFYDPSGNILEMVSSEG